MYRYVLIILISSFLSVLFSETMRIFMIVTLAIRTAEVGGLSFIFHFIKVKGNTVGSYLILKLVIFFP